MKNLESVAAKLLHVNQKCRFKKYVTEENNNNNLNIPLSLHKEIAAECQKQLDAREKKRKIGSGHPYLSPLHGRSLPKIRGKKVDIQTGRVTKTRKEFIKETKALFKKIAEARLSKKLEKEWVFRTSAYGNIYRVNLTTNGKCSHDTERYKSGWHRVKRNMFSPEFGKIFIINMPITYKWKIINRQLIIHHKGDNPLVNNPISHPIYYYYQSYGLGLTEVNG